MARRKTAVERPRGADAIEELLKPRHGQASAPRLPARRPDVLPLEAPKHLRPDTATWWASVAADYLLEPHHVRLLTLACEAWDRCHEARQALEKHGLTYADRFGQPHPRPEVSIERDSRIGFARLVRELNLDLDPPDEQRPPRL